MSALWRRLVFGCFWGAIFWLALLIMGGGIAGSLVDQSTAPQTTLRAGEGISRPVDVAAGVRFRERYGWHVIAGAVVLAAAGTLSGILPGTRRK